MESGESCNILLIYSDFTFNLLQNVLLSLQHLASFVSHLLEPCIATMTLTIAAAVIVLRTSRFPVSLTQPLGLDSGSQHFALRQAVAARVSAIVMNF